MSSSSLYRADSNSASVSWVGNAPAPRNPVAAMRLRVVRRQLVAGNLPADELVVRHVLIEGLDQEIAVMIGVRPVVVLLVAVRLGKPGHVHPVPCPALAEVGRVEQPVDQPLVGVGRRVVDERVDLLGRRRQPGQVEVEPPDQHAAIGRRVRRQAALPRAWPG